MDIKPLGKIAEKWAKRASAAGPDYKEGVLTTPKDQAGLAIAAAPAYEAGVTEAIGRGAFQKGLQEAGTAKWKKKASEKGSRRYPEGVRDAEPEFQSGFAPMHAALSGLTLPPRGLRNSSENYERSRIVGNTLHEVRVGS